MASVQEIADKVVAANRSGEIEALLAEHYADDVVSVEAVAMDPAKGREIHGLDGIRGKHAWWNDTMEEHSTSVEGPFVHGDDRFAVIYEIDVTNKQSGERMQMREVAVYHVANGKVVREEFFYAA